MQFITFLLIKVNIKGYEIDSCLEATDLAIDLDISIVTLVVDVLNQYSNLFMDVTVATCEKIDLVELAESLSQITTSFLH